MNIYVIGPKEGPQKIGLSSNVDRRLQTLQTGYPEQLYVHHTESVSHKKVRLLEKKIHKELNHKKLKGEWFNLTPDEAKDFVIFFNIRHCDDPFLGL